MSKKNKVHKQAEEILGFTLLDTLPSELAEIINSMTDVAKKIELIRKHLNKREKEG